MKLEEVSVLVIDDVNAVRIQIGDMMRGYGFRNIIQAGNAERGKEILEEEKINLVLCDWHMEPTNGMDLLTHMRSHNSFDTIAFIMVTAESTKDLVLEAIAAGVDDYLIKPLTPGKIEERIGNVLKKRGIT